MHYLYLFVSNYKTNPDHNIVFPGRSNGEISEDEREPEHEVPPAAADVRQAHRRHRARAAVQADQPGRRVQHRTRGTYEYSSVAKQGPGVLVPMTFMSSLA